MKDELEGDHIVEFASGGAKNYTYKTACGKIECKVRGLTLNFAGKEVVNFETMKENVLSEVQDPREDGQRRQVKVTNPNQFLRDPQQKKLRLVRQDKIYQLVDARVIRPTNFTSVPYGFSRN